MTTTHPIPRWRQVACLFSFSLSFLFFWLLFVVAGASLIGVFRWRRARVDWNGDVCGDLLACACVRLWDACLSLMLDA